MQPPKAGTDADAHHNELSRLAALLRYEILDSAEEAAFDDFTQLASRLCDTPIALISLVDDRRQWFKSRVGLAVSETPRDISFCSHAIRGSEIFEVPDALADPRFRDNPLVTGEPGIRFYAGTLLRTPDGHNLGTLCVIDRKPRRLSADQRDALWGLFEHPVEHLAHALGTAARELRSRRRRNQAVVHVRLRKAARSRCSRSPRDRRASRPGRSWARPYT